MELLCEESHCGQGKYNAGYPHYPSQKPKRMLKNLKDQAYKSLRTESTCSIWDTDTIGIKKLKGIQRRSASFCFQQIQPSLECDIYIEI